MFLHTCKRSQAQNAVVAVALVSAEPFETLNCSCQTSAMKLKQQCCRRRFIRNSRFRSAAAGDGIPLFLKWFKPHDD